MRRIQWWKNFEAVTFGSRGMQGSKIDFFKLVSIYVFRRENDPGERISALGPLVLEILRSEAPIRLRAFSTGLCGIGEWWPNVVLYVTWCGKFDGEKILSLACLVFEIYGVEVG